MMKKSLAAVVPPLDDEIPFYRILGTPISIVSLDRILRLFAEWTVQQRDRYVVLRDVHGVMRARTDARLRNAHEAADVVAPDGMPLVWLAKIAGLDGISRVCGPDLMPAVCVHGIGLGWRHFFLGGAPGVAEQLIEKLRKKYPGIEIAGFHCPPFRPISETEDKAICAAIRSARADFVWVGLGTPKQEIWMHEHQGRCGGSILLGVGAAFDFHAGLVSRAPLPMQRYGLEWLFRLSQEPKRLWQRYLMLAPKFAFLATYELLRGRIALNLQRPVPPV